MAKVSIIVPIFNTQYYIKKCLDSLVNQTLKDIEIICVNDGSTDDSMVIVRAFAKSDSRIKIVEQKHLKQGAARNNGTRFACGEYIGFVDSDDWVDLEYFEKLYDAATRHGVDIALATNVRIGNGKTKKRLNIEKEEMCNTLQEKFDISCLAKNPCPTNKIYKADLLKNNDITWPEDCYCEDKLFVTKAVYYANGIVAVPGINYYYFRNPNSTVSSKSRQLIVDKNRARRDVLNFLKEKNADIRDREFWALKEEKRFCGIPLYVKKESLKSAKTVLLGFITFYEAIE